MNRKKTERRLICLVAAISLLIPTLGTRAGGLVDADLKSGASLEEKSDFQRAAEAYARALRLEPGNRKAKTGLGRVAGPAIAGRMAAARDLEASLRFTDAQVELNAAVALQDRVRAAGIALDDSIDAAAAYEDLIDRWVEQLHSEAVAAQGDEMWSAAVAHLRKIESMRPAYRDVRARLVEVWTAWGNQEIDLGMVRSAADRFTEAARVPGNTNYAAADRAATIMARLGAYALERGFCRSSVRDLRAAMILAPDAVQPDTLDRAESCALTCLSLTAGSNPETGLEPSKVETIGAEIRNLVANRGSRFLSVTRSTSKDRNPCNSRPPAGAAAATGPRRIRVTVEITSQVMLRAPATSRNSEFRSQQRIGSDLVGESVMVIRLYEEVFSGSMTGTITLVDQRSGRTSPTIPIRAQGETVAQWVKNPATMISTGTAARQTGMATRPGQPGLDRLVRVDDQRQAARSELREALIRDFVDEATRIILDTVDAEPGINDPVSIDLGVSPSSTEGTETHETP